MKCAASYTLTVISDGAQGKPGVGVSSIVREFALSSSSTSAPSSGWSTTRPSRNAGQTIWVRDKSTYSDGKVVYSTPYPATGDKGDTGATGPKGDKGETGPQGEKGDKGETGAQGPQGPQGNKGDKGDKGETGEKGPQGDKGNTGAQGNGYYRALIALTTSSKSVAKGNVSPASKALLYGDTIVDTNGLVFAVTAATSSSASTVPIEYRYSIKGPQGNKGDKGDKGDTGATGPQGPKGDKGETGATGPQGPKGDKGETGNTGAAGTPAVDFSILASPTTYAMTSRQYVKTQQVFKLTCRKMNYTGSSQAVWSLSSTDGISFCDEAGSTYYSGANRTSDTVYVAVKVGCVKTSFKLTCSLEGLGIKELAVAGSYPEYKPQYIGKVDSTLDQEFPTMTADGPIREGDVIVYVYESGGTKKSQYKVCTSVGTDSEGNITTSWADNSVQNSGNSELMISGIYDAIMSGSDNADLLSMVKQLVAQYIAAEYINITGAIFGGAYEYNEKTKEITNPTGGMGFLLSKNGVFEAISAYLRNASVTGDFEAKDGDKIIMKTSKYQEGDVIKNDYSDAYIEVEKGGNIEALYTSLNRFYVKFDGNTKRYESLGYANGISINKNKYLAWGSKIFSVEDAYRKVGSNASGWQWYICLDLSNIEASINTKAAIQVTVGDHSVLTIVKLNSENGSRLENWGRFSNQTKILTELEAGNKYYLFCDAFSDSSKNYKVKVILYNKSLDLNNLDENTSYVFIESHGALTSIDEPLGVSTTPPEIIKATGYSKEYSGPVFNVYKETDDSFVGTSNQFQNLFNSGFHIKMKNISDLFSITARGLFDVSETSEISVNQVVSYGITTYKVNTVDIKDEQIIFNTSQGVVRIEKKEDDNKNFILSNVTLIVSHFGLIASSLLPSVSDSVIGTESNPYSIGYINNLSGNVNEEGDTEHKVWGAVFN